MGQRSLREQARRELDTRERRFAEDRDVGYKAADAQSVRNNDDRAVRAAFVGQVAQFATANDEDARLAASWHLGGKVRPRRAAPCCESKSGGRFGTTVWHVAIFLSLSLSLALFLSLSLSLSLSRLFGGGARHIASSSNVLRLLPITHHLPCPTLRCCAAGAGGSHARDVAAFGFRDAH